MRATTAGGSPALFHTARTPPAADRRTYGSARSAARTRRTRTHTSACALLQHRVRCVAEQQAAMRPEGRAALCQHGVVERAHRELPALGLFVVATQERRVGKECRSRWSPY